MRPAQLGRLVEGLHARGSGSSRGTCRGTKPALDVRRSLAMLSFRTATGQPFDGVALNIESTRPGTPTCARGGLSRSRSGSGGSGGDAARDRAVQPARARAPAEHVATVPWAELAATSDAFAPMVYTGGAFRGFDATYGYVTRALRLLRAQTGNPDVPIHVAGGVADRMGARSSRASSPLSPTTVRRSA